MPSIDRATSCDARSDVNTLARVDLADLYYITLHHIHYITLHNITLHYITLHYLQLDGFDKERAPPGASDACLYAEVRK